MPICPDTAAPSPGRPARLGVLLSGGGTTMLNLADQIRAGTLDASIQAVVASNDACRGIERARQLGLACEVVRRKDFQGDNAVAMFSEAVFARLREAGVELVCMAGFLSLLVIPDDFAGRVMNIHPSLLPKFGGKGMHGLHVHTAVLAAGETTTGCTVHLADNTYDTGPVLLQQTCEVRPGETAQALAARVFELEKQAYPEAIRRFIQDRQRSSR